MKKNKKEIYCNFDYFMKHGCKGCKLERMCEEWGRNRFKRHSNSGNTNNLNNSSSKTK